MQTLWRASCSLKHFVRESWASWHPAVGRHKSMGQPHLAIRSYICGIGQGALRVLESLSAWLCLAVGAYPSLVFFEPGLLFSAMLV